MIVLTPNSAACLANANCYLMVAFTELQDSMVK